MRRARSLQRALRGAFKAIAQSCPIPQCRLWKSDRREGPGRREAGCGVAEGEGAARQPRVRVAEHRDLRIRRGRVSGRFGTSALAACPHSLLHGTIRSPGRTPARPLSGRSFVRASREHMQHPTDHAYSTPRKRLAAQVSARASRGSTPQRPPRASSRDGVSPPPSKVHSVARLNDARDADPPPSRLQVASHTETAPPHAARSLHAAIEAARSGTC